MPYAIEKIDTGEIVRRFGELPKSFDLPNGQRIISPVAVGDEGLGYRFIEVVQVDFTQPGADFRKGALVVSRVGNVRTETQEWITVVRVDFDPPGVYFTQGADVEVLDGNTLTITRSWTPWTQPEIDAYEAAELEIKAAHFDEVGGDTRALAHLVLDEINLHAQRITAILDAIDGASSLAQVKTAIALIPDVPQRTSAQLRAAFKAKLVNGG